MKSFRLLFLLILCVAFSVVIARAQKTPTSITLTKGFGPSQAFVAAGCNIDRYSETASLNGGGPGSLSNSLASRDWKHLRPGITIFLPSNCAEPATPEVKAASWKEMRYNAHSTKKTTTKTVTQRIHNKVHSLIHRNKKIASTNQVAPKKPFVITNKEAKALVVVKPTPIPTQGIQTIPQANKTNKEILAARQKAITPVAVPALPTVRTQTPSQAEATSAVQKHSHSLQKLLRTPITWAWLGGTALTLLAIYLALCQILGRKYFFQNFHASGKQRSLRRKLLLKEKEQYKPYSEFPWDVDKPAPHQLSIARGTLVSECVGFRKKFYIHWNKGLKFTRRIRVFKCACCNSANRVFYKEDIEAHLRSEHTADEMQQSVVEDEFRKSPPPTRIRAEKPKEVEQEALIASK